MIWWFEKEKTSRKRLVTSGNTSTTKNESRSGAANADAIIKETDKDVGEPDKSNISIRLTNTQLRVKIPQIFAKWLKKKKKVIYYSNNK